ncbi:putative RNA-binding protein Luc7-like 2 isoform X1 [Mizuhopecten yessoensis]|uniref:putative RNA-binding protein Luc7-like 2 isoform X1 n=2 Tax=Mizuhopecten yessoensis TaxID=6573 RepID=UPI000B457DD1|nr:putative RNA-binding protein Luc7-like 2 isoform X1 [Mizuhopecten yessoensis]
MSAQDQMRAMLDELMGTSRNGDTAKYKVKFDDPRVCKSFLLACCPHDILSSTRMDLGECPKIHDLALRADYEWATKKKDYYYDIDAMEHLQSFIADCDRKTEMAKRRLKETQEELSEEANQKAEKIHALGEQLGENMAKAETMGGEGEVEESLKLMEEVEELKKNKSLAEQDYRNSMPASSYQQQKLRVCEVCSAYLGIHDNDRRLADHFGGKLHLGFITIREKLEELKVRINTRVAERRNLREKEREEQKVKREKEEEARKSKSASPVRRRSRSTSKRSRSRSKSRKRSRSRSNSRDKNRRRRSRSSSRSRRRSTSRTNDRRSHKRSRHSRSRSKSRRSRSRGSRSRRSRSRRSRSRSRSRSRRHKRRSRSRSRRSRSRSKSRRHRHRSRSASASRRSRSAERDRRRDSRSKS